jgi:hypothetical protein
MKANACELEAPAGAEAQSLATDTLILNSIAVTLVCRHPRLVLDCELIPLPFLNQLRTSPRDPKQPQLARLTKASLAAKFEPLQQ